MRKGVSIMARPANFDWAINQALRICANGHAPHIYVVFLKSNPGLQDGQEYDYL